MKNPQQQQKIKKKMSESEDDSSQSFPLHECIFEGDLKNFSQLLRTHDVAKKDTHGEYKIIGKTLNSFI